MSPKKIQWTSSQQRRPRKRKSRCAKPASRQYIMMGLGVLVLVLLIVGIGSRA